MMGRGTMGPVDHPGSMMEPPQGGFDGSQVAPGGQSRPTTSQDVRASGFPQGDPRISGYTGQFKTTRELRVC